MALECQLQAAFRAPAACTIRVTVTDGVTPDTANWVIAEGDSWASLDAMIAAWNAAMVADFSVGNCTAEVVSSPTNGDGYTRLTSTYGTIAVTWSYAGDGSAVRNWLGWSADVTAGSSPRNATTGYHPGLYLDEPPERMDQTARRRARSQRRMLGGQTETQHDTAPGAEDSGPVALVLRLSSWTQVGRIPVFVAAVLADGTGADGRFTATSDGRSLTVRCSANPVEVVVEPVSCEDGRALFRVPLAVEVAS